MTKKEFLDEHDKYGDIELNNDESSKLRGMPYPGAKVKIEWVSENGKPLCIDSGYLFLTPFQDDGIDDYFIHVPRPDNPGGKDSVEPEWSHINKLLKNKYCRSIIVTSIEN